MRKLVTLGFITMLVWLSSSTAMADERTLLETVLVDAQVVGRVAEMAQRDLPRELLLRIVEQDIDLLRGRRDNGSYSYAHFEMIESGRITERFTVRPEERDGQLDRKQFRGKNVYKIIVNVPGRRMLVARNRDLYLERIVVDYEDQQRRSRSRTFDVGRTIDAGEQMEFDLGEVASDAVATVYARSERKTSNIEVIFLKASLIDNADSPWFGLVQNAKLLREAVDRRDQTTMQSLAATLASRVGAVLERDFVRTAARAPVREEEPVPHRPLGTPPEIALEAPPVLEIYLQLQQIQDYLTGTEVERREGLDLLHQLIRNLRRAALAEAAR
jgi:hypothetical protein